MHTEIFLQKKEKASNRRQNIITYPTTLDLPVVVIIFGNYKFNRDINYKGL